MEEVLKKEVGYVTKVNNYLLTIKGLPSVRINDIIVDKNNRRAVVNSTSSDYIEALLLDKGSVNPGVEFFVDTSTCIDMGYELKGKVINALGSVVSVKEEEASSIKKKAETKDLLLDAVAKNIDSRDFIKEQLVTGLSLIDIIMPVGKGQRELVYGPINSGKGEFLTDVVINQKRLGNICIYAAIGKPSTFTSRLIKELDDAGVLDNTIIVSALSDEPAPMITIAPSTAFMIAEYFCNKGEDVVLILDDLGIHAKYIREVALLSEQFPGRESYPGDIFYQHAHLMERSGSFNEKQGNGTITLFPVLETDVEGFTNIIPTNLMASTDGHLFFSTEMHSEGFKPSVSVLQSVTRVGHMTHSNIQRELSTKLMNILSEYPRQQEYSRFGTQVSSRTRDILKKGRVIYELLNQNAVGFISLSNQIMLLSLVFTSFFDSEDKDVEMVRSKKREIIKFLNESDSLSSLREKIGSDSITVEDLISEMNDVIERLDSALFGKKSNKENEDDDKSDGSEEE